MGEYKAPRVKGKASVFGLVILFGILAFLWIFPTVSAVGLLTMKPASITITGCVEPVLQNKNGDESGCWGTWTDPDGTTHEDVVTGWISGHAFGDVEDGYVIFGKGRLSVLPWILDVAITYPIAILVTFVPLYDKFSTARRRRRYAEGRMTPEEAARFLANEAARVEAAKKHGVEFDES